MQLLIQVLTRLQVKPPLIQLLIQVLTPLLVKQQTTTALLQSNHLHLQHAQMIANAGPKVEDVRQARFLSIGLEIRTRAQELANAQMLQEHAQMIANAGPKVEDARQARFLSIGLEIRTRAQELANAQMIHAQTIANAGPKVEDVRLARFQNIGLEIRTRAQELANAHLVLPPHQVQADHLVLPLSMSISITSVARAMLTVLLTLLEQLHVEQLKSMESQAHRRHVSCHHFVDSSRLFKELLELLSAVPHS